MKPVRNPQRRNPSKGTLVGALNMFLFSALFSSMLFLAFGSNDFLQEVPVKLLNIRSVASRYPASNSTYRQASFTANISKFL